MEQNPNISDLQFRLKAMYEDTGETAPRRAAKDRMGRTRADAHAYTLEGAKHTGRTRAQKPSGTPKRALADRPTPRRGQ